MSAKIKKPYASSLSVNHDILTLSCHIAYKLGRLSCLGTLSPNQKDISESLKYTLLLEGVILTPSQLRGLTMGEKCENVPIAYPLRELLSKISKIDPYDPKIIDDFEKALWKGEAPKRKEEQIDGFDYPLPSSSKAKALLRSVFDFGKANPNISPIILACLFYFEVMAIAPYSQYNGLLARYLFKAYLGVSGRSLWALPIEKAIYFHEKELSKAFNESIAKLDTSIFVSCLLDIVNLTLEGVMKEAAKQTPSSSPLIDKLLSKMEEGEFYSANELCLLLGLKSRLGLAKNYLRPALKAGKIEMSNPLCPTDRNQRYGKRR